MKKIIILGAGPTGIALGIKLLNRYDLRADVLIIEEKAYVGGMASSFEYEGLHFDYGSHRLHPMISSEILNDIRSLLGPSLLNRPRNGRIRILGNFVKFPLKPLDIAMNLPPSFFSGILRDMITKPFKKRKQNHVSFADVLMYGLGETACKHFYFPYARKLWGLPPEKISAVQARKRISANSFGKMVLRILQMIPGLKHRKGAGHFFYPRKGFGQICLAMSREIERKGGRILFSTNVHEVYHQDRRGFKVLIKPSRSTSAHDTKSSNADLTYKTYDADMIFSTIPINILINSLRPAPPEDVIDASSNLRYRGMVLCYLILGINNFTLYDAHYFPEEDVIISRISEPKNYSNACEPPETTGLCAEIPCWVGDDIWNASENEISRTVINDLARTGLHVNALVKDVFTRRLSHAYPLYDLKYEKRIHIVEKYCEKIPGIVTLGRQGIFIHDNTHHAFEMAYAASNCFKRNGDWDLERWLEYKKRFKAFIVED